MAVKSFDENSFTNESNEKGFDGVMRIIENSFPWAYKKKKVLKKYKCIF